jgi:hypothetical protein
MKGESAGMGRIPPADFRYPTNKPDAFTLFLQFFYSFIIRFIDYLSITTI